MGERELPPADDTARGLLAGATVGALLTAAVFGAGGLFSLEGGHASGALAAMLIVALPALVVWGIGLLCVGLPAWAVLCRLGATSRAAAMATGAGLCFGTGLLFAGFPVSDFALLFATALGLVGGVVGWVVRWVAYDTP